MGVTKQDLDSLDDWHHSELDKLRDRGEDTLKACDQLDKQYKIKLRALHRRQDEEGRD